MTQYYKTPIPLHSMEHTETAEILKTDLCQCIFILDHTKAPGFFTCMHDL